MTTKRTLDRAAQVALAKAALIPLEVEFRQVSRRLDAAKNRLREAEALIEVGDQVRYEEFCDKRCCLEFTEQGIVTKVEHTAGTTLVHFQGRTQTYQRQAHFLIRC